MRLKNPLSRSYSTKLIKPISRSYSMKLKNLLSWSETYSMKLKNPLSQSYSTKLKKPISRSYSTKCKNPLSWSETYSTKLGGVTPRNAKIPFRGGRLTPRKSKNLVHGVTPPNLLHEQAFWSRL